MSTKFLIPDMSVSISNFPYSIIHGKITLSPEEPITISCNCNDPLIKISYLLNDVWTEYTQPYILTPTDTFTVKFDIELLTQNTEIEFINLSDNNSIITKALFLIT